MIVTFANNDINGSITQITSTTNLPLLNSQQNIGEDEATEVGDKDVDFWKFNSPEAGILEIDIEVTTTDTVALLFDGDGRLLTEVPFLFDSGGRLLAEDEDDNPPEPLLRYRINPNTDYFVAITGFGNENFDPFALGTGSGGDTGAYTINASLLDPNQFDSLTDNSVASELVQNIILDRVIAGNVGEDNGFALGAEDIDLYRFIPENDSTINITVNANEAFSADTFLRLFDAQGNEIAFNDDATDLTRGSLLQQDVIANTEYIIGINGSSDNARDYNPLTGEGAATSSVPGSYNLTITEVETNPEPEPVDLLETDIFRFQNTDVPGTYLYAAAAEAQNIRENFSNFREEGLAFQVAVEPGDDLIPLYRFQSQVTPGTYLFVGDEERTGIKENFSEQFTEEGLAFYVYGVDAGKGTPFSRFQNTELPGTYLFAGLEESNNIEANFPNFVNEGIAFEVDTEFI